MFAGDANVRSFSRTRFLHVRNVAPITAGTVTLEHLSVEQYLYHVCGTFVLLCLRLMVLVHDARAEMAEASTFRSAMHRPGVAVH